MALYQKYRPKTLGELVGQDFIRLTLQAALQKNQVAHAYLFYGTRGTGKTSTARILAKALNCLNPDKNGDPCNECDFCIAADNGSFVDLIEIDGASNRRIEDARALIEKIRFTPTLGKRKVYIIDEVHMLTKEAFNALLKTIEEPPDHAYFLLATTELAKVPETIRSRCQVFTFHKFTPQQIIIRLSEIAEKEGIITEEQALSMIAKKAAGGLRDAIGILQQVAAGGDVLASRVADELGISSAETITEFQEFLSAKNPRGALDLILRLAGEGLSLTDFLEQYLGLLRERMVTATLEAANLNVLEQILVRISYFDEARRQLRDAPIPTLPIEIAIVKTLLAESSSGVFTHEIAPTSAQKDKPKTATPQVQEPSTQKSANEPLLPEAPKNEMNPQLVTPLNDETLRSAQGEIMKLISDPVLKVGLRNAKWSITSPTEILLTFPSQTYREQCEDTKRFPLLIEKIRDIFGNEVQVITDTVPVVLEPVEAGFSSTETDDKPVVDPNEVRKIFGLS